MSKRIYILLLTCCLTLGMRAEEPVVQSTYSYRRFTTHDGLPQMQTEVIWQDSKGYIYRSMESELQCASFNLRVIYFRWRDAPFHAPRG